MDLTQNGLRVTGTWNAKTGINVSTGADSETPAGGQEFDLRNMSFVVITALVSIAPTIMSHNIVDFLLTSCILYNYVVVSADKTVRHDEAVQQHAGRERPL